MYSGCNQILRVCMAGVPHSNYSLIMQQSRIRSHCRMTLTQGLEREEGAYRDCRGLLQAMHGADAWRMAAGAGCPGLGGPEQHLGELGARRGHRLRVAENRRSLHPPTSSLVSTLIANLCLLADMVRSTVHGRVTCAGCRSHACMALYMHPVYSASSAHTSLRGGRFSSTRHPCIVAS